LDYCFIQLTLADLCAIDPELGAGLQALLNFEEGTGSIEDVLGVTFTASANPLVDRSAGSGGAGQDEVSTRWQCTRCCDVFFCCSTVMVHTYDCIATRCNTCLFSTFYRAMDMWS
jgi:hypothetical protein